MNIIRKSQNILTKVDKDGRFAGYASVFGLLDEHNDVVIKGAYKTSIENFNNSKKPMNMYFNHDPSVPIGKWTKIEEDNYGLYVEGQLLFSLPMSHAVEAMMQRTSLGLSVGMYVTKSSRGNYNGKQVREIHDVRLAEISVTPKPVNSKARCFNVSLATG